MPPIMFAILGLLIIPLFALITLLFQTLWNATMPHAFDQTRQIGFWVAFRLLCMGFLASSGLTLHFGR